MHQTLTLLHTAAAHVESFDRLLAAMAPGARVRHVVRADLLAQARRLGSAHDEVIAGVAGALGETPATGVVLCTCSTLGGIAERLGRDTHRCVLRVDRPMAEQAVRSGRRVLVVAALESTLEPTLALLHEAAAAGALETMFLTSLCGDAWVLFEAGRTHDYLHAVATHIERHAGTADVVVLAQASMAPVADLRRAGVPILSSPASGLRAALVAAGYPLQSADA